VLTILSTLVALSVLILIHEFGHFFAAKAVGILAPRFSLGLGPRVAGFKVGETDFVVSAIPLGGYVKMAGMEDDEAMETLEGGTEAEPVPADRTFDSKSLPARILVITAGVIMNLLFAWLVMMGIALVKGEQYVPTTRLAPLPGIGGSAAQTAQIPVGASVTAVANQPVQSWDDMQDLLERAPAGEVPLTLAEAPAVRLDLPPAGPSRDSVLGALQPLSEPVLETVVPDGAAAKAGLRPGDRILAIGGQPVRTWPEAVEHFRASPGRALQLDVDRGGRRIAATMTPTAATEKTPEGSKRIGKIGASGLPPLAYRHVGVGAALALGTKQTWRMVTLITTTLRDLVTGAISPRNLGGLLAIGEASGESARLGWAYYLRFLALMSVNLAVLNLLPIPILDGGHLMFLLAEAVRGRPLSMQTRIRLSHAGLIIVVGLMLWANGNDVVRYVGRLMGR